MQVTFTHDDLNDPTTRAALLRLVRGDTVVPAVEQFGKLQAEPSESEAPTDTAEQDDCMLDANGFPWDARIHSSSRERIKDGTWKLRRGVAPELIESVRAAFTQPEVVEVTDAAQIGFGEPAQEVPPPPPADDWPTDILGEKVQPFQQFMQYCMSRMNGGVSSQKLLELANRHGLQQLAFANQFPDKIPAMVRELATL